MSFCACLSFASLNVLYAKLHIILDANHSNAPVSDNNCIIDFFFSGIFEDVRCDGAKMLKLILLHALQQQLFE